MKRRLFANSPIIGRWLLLAIAWGLLPRPDIGKARQWMVVCR